MHPQITIDGHDFAVYSVSDAIALAVEKARGLLGAGETAAGEALYAEATRLRQEYQSALSLCTEPSRRSASRQSTQRWQRRVDMLYGRSRR